MDERDRLDLSPLGVDTDGERWRSVMNSTMARVDVVLNARPQDPLTLIASWTKPLTIGAILVIALLIPIEMMLEKREADVEKVDRLVELSTERAFGDRQPTGADLLQVFGAGIHR